MIQRDRTIISIDLKEGDGNIFALLGRARFYAKKLGLDHEAITKEMMSSDYENAIKTFEKYFGDFVIFGEIKYEKDEE